MRMVIKFVLYALVVILLVSWLTTVVKSCGNDTDSGVTSENFQDAADPSVPSEEEAIVNDLLESAEDAEAVDAADQTDAPRITSIDYSKKLDKDEEALLQKVAKEKEQREEPAGKPATEVKDPPKPAATSSSGNYFVITGSFGEEGNAKKQQQKLRSLGYASAEVVQFDGSKLYSVISGRYASNSEAARVADELKTRHKVDCYVKKKEL